MEYIYIIVFFALLLVLEQRQVLVEWIGVKQELRHIEWIYCNLLVIPALVWIAFSCSRELGCTAVSNDFYRVDVFDGRV